MINTVAPQVAWEEEWTTNEINHALKTYIQQTGSKGRVIWILNMDQPVPAPLEDRGYWDIKTVTAGTKGWRNSWNCHQLPTTMQNSHHGK